ncbi:neprosin family prolyl endopeptidase [Myxococcus llanfairpwllgwyngyllgogerychwyrndrobwllllantysiliogogogochensis]|nr:neprosin family prolyl endopeptidase [Myxococcus llanfairpwllgwyngyllgogerychwyrndrobwllllantysiliogogogochensis]
MSEQRRSSCVQRKGMRLGLMSWLCLSVVGCGGVSEPEVAGPEQSSSASAMQVERVRDSAELAKMRDYVDSLYDAKSVVHRFTSKGGDGIDCVPLYAQPALRQPGMENHRIQLAPGTEPVLPPERLAPSPTAPSEKWRAQPAALEGLETAPDDLDATGALRRCPVGSVPIVRLTLDTLKRFESLEDFRQKVPGHLRGNVSVETDKLRSLASATPSARSGPTDLHQYAHTAQGVSNWGAEAIFNIWSPYTELSSEFSLSQMWVVRGSGSNLETVEAGWQKYRDLYGDDRARLFIYFTPDNYGSGGCYNLSCGAFVQVNNTVSIGGGFNNYSVTNGAQYEFKLMWFKDGTTGAWWLKFQDIWVGYYPRTRFDAAGLMDRADVIDFGGEIIDNRNGNLHTSTDMGGGAYPGVGWANAAYTRNLLYVDTTNVYREPTSLGAWRNDSNCYDIIQYNNPGGWGRYFYFGGPGYNANCM